MVGWSDVTRWNPAALQDAVGAINAAYNKLVACSDDLRDINTPTGGTVTLPAPRRAR